jgi:hypothetical protein
MGLSRFEFNVYTLERSEISQVAYRNKGGEIIVLDSGQKPPDGFIPFDPHDERELTDS